MNTQKKQRKALEKALKILREAGVNFYHDVEVKRHVMTWEGKPAVYEKTYINTLVVETNENVLVKNENQNS